MTFEAYITNIQIKTGKEPRDFYEQAVTQGVLRPDTKAMEFVNWLKASSGLGHGHAMAVWEAFRRSGWIPLSESKSASGPAARARVRKSRKETRK